MAQMEKYLPAALFATGVTNVILIKYADKLKSVGSNGNAHYFEHPFLQTALLFFSELLCFAVFKIIFFCLRRRMDGSEENCVLTAGNRDFRPTVFFLPAVLDVIASSMLFIGIYLTYASSFQIIQGLLVIFTGIFSANFLNQSIKTNQWIGMFIIFIGSVLVAISDYFALINGENVDHDAKAAITGDLFIACSQVFKGIQIVYEERYMKALEIPPLQAIGWEGIFGFAIMCIALIPLSYSKSYPPFNKNPNAVFEDLADAFSQMTNNYVLIILHLIFILSICFYSFAGISISKNFSASHRAAFDCVRTFVIFVISMYYEWDKFYYLQLIAVILLFCGLFIYRNIVFIDFYRWIIGRCLRRRYGDATSEEVLSQPADSV